MNKKYDLAGKRFERLDVIKRVENSKSGQARWLCKCDCGNETIVLGNHLRSGHTRSCGCINKEQVKNIKHYKKHGMALTRIYKIWNGMKNRCNEKSKYKNTRYRNYGGRGIKVCDEWEVFERFYDWAMNNGYSDNLTIDRIDANGNYEPNNCRWITMKEQQNNKRNNHVLEYNGEKLTISQWADKLNMTTHLISNRLRHGWTIERALNYGKQY